jgi:DNA-binding MarR family transcriptional regulator
MTTQRASADRERRGGQHRDVLAVIDGLRQINRRLRQTARVAEQRLGISGAQLFVLQELAAAPAASVGELADRTFTHYSSVSVVVSRLVESGLVTRAPARNDNRRSEITLTARGRQLLRRAPTAAQAELTAAVSRLPRRTLHQLARSVRRLTESLAAADAPATPTPRSLAR